MYTYILLLERKTHYYANLSLEILALQQMQKLQMTKHFLLAQVAKEITNGIRSHVQKYKINQCKSHCNILKDQRGQTRTIYPILQE